jgi:tetratricopeptide (TPR) repeat protein
MSLVDHPEKGAEAMSIVQRANDGAFSSDSKVLSAYVDFLLSQPNRETLLPNFATRLVEKAQTYQSERPADAMSLLAIAEMYADEMELQKLKEVRMSLTESWWEKEPQNVRAACSYVLDREDTLDEAKQREILMPFLSDAFLKDSEAARILGGILFRDGRYQEAVALLQQYTQPRMDRFHSAVKNYETTLQKRQDFYFAELDQGKGTKEFYDAYEKADEAGKNSLVNDYLVEKFQKDIQVQRALEQQELAGRMVGPVMQLGIAQLNLSREIESTSERMAMLQNAEKTFLSIRGAVGETDEYRLFLGEISYWLGRHKEGKALFDELLKDNARSTTWLMEVGIRLRDVGEIDSSRTMLEEAWNKELDPKVKQSIAGTRQIIAIDLKDRAKWLSRCDDTQSHIKCAQHENAAYLALEEGRNEAAVTEFKKALAEYKNNAESSSKLNNEALVWQSLALLTGKIEDFRAGVESMERSLRLQQSSITTTNLATAYQSLANWKINERIFDLSYISDLAGSSLFFVHCVNAADSEALTKELLASPEIIQSVKLFNQVRVMAPKNPESYGALFLFHSLAKNNDELQELFEQVTSAKIDFTDSYKRAVEAYQKKFTDADRINVETSLARYRKTLASLPENAKPATRALLETFIITQENVLRSHSASAVAPPVEPLLIRAKDLHQRAVSSGTTDLYIEMLCEAAMEELRKNSRIEEIYRLNERQFETDDIVTLLVTQEELAPLLAQNEYLKLAYQLTQESNQLSGHDASLRLWVWSRLFDPEQTSMQLQRIKDSKYKQLVTEIQYELAPYNANNTFYRHLLALALGDEAKAKQVWDEAKNVGIRFID